MSKKHLTKIWIYFFFSIKNPYIHIFKTQSLKFPFPLFFYIKRYKSRKYRRYSMSKWFCKFISVASWTCALIWIASCCYYQLITCDNFFFPDFIFNCKAFKFYFSFIIIVIIIFLRYKTCIYIYSFCIKSDFNTSIFHLTIKCWYHIRWMVWRWKNSVSSFDFKIQPKFSKETHRIIIRKFIKWTVHEFFICHNAVHKVIWITCISKIASAFSGYKNLFSQFLVFFNKNNFIIISGRCNCCHHPGSTSAYNYNFFHFITPN